MTFIVDASVALLWLIDLPASKEAEQLLQRDETIIAPDILVPEIANALWKAVSFAGLPSAEAQDAMRTLDRFFSEIAPTSPLRDRALAIALELKHPAYDCFYLAFAEQRACPLITADKRLVRRATKTPFEKLISELV